MNFIFDETKSTPLCEIMGRNKSDKGSLDIQSSWHNYTTVYYSIFKEIKDIPLRVFELGLGTNNVKIPSNMGINGRPGASLYGWNEFFTNPNSQIFGADIDKNILFKTENNRITTYYCDQTNPHIINDMWNKNELLKEEFDVIIDDGLHDFKANVCFFENSIHKLKSKGFFIIEDIKNFEKDLFNNKIKEWQLKYTNLSFKLLPIPSIKNKIDNTLLICFKNNI